MLRRAKGDQCDKHWRPNEPFVKVHLKVCQPLQSIAFSYRPFSRGTQRFEEEVLGLCLRSHVRTKALSIRIIVQARHGDVSYFAFETITLALRYLRCEG